MRSCRSILFVPADRPDRYGKALTSGAHAVCVDLEDAVPPGRKGDGRAALEGLLAGPDGGAVPLLVRTNEAGSAKGRVDMELLATAQRRAADAAKVPPVAAVMLPKVRSAGNVREALRLLQANTTPVLPLIETALGLENAVEIAGAAPRVAGLVFGGFDLCLELGAEPCWESLLYARSRVVHAAAVHSLPAFDMPSRQVGGDLAELREETFRVRRLGFSGKTAIHPAQLPVVHQAFARSVGDPEHSRRIVEADRQAHGGPVLVDGKMVDRPIVEAAKRALERNAPDPEPPTL